MASHPLPQEVLLRIISSCEILILQRLLLTNSTVRNLIQTYQNSLCSVITTNSSTIDDIEAFRLPKTCSWEPLQALFVLEYRIQIARWLSAVTLENYRNENNLSGTGTSGNIGADEVWGDTARRHVFVGWDILWRLSDIARSILELETTSNSTKGTLISSLTREMDNRELRLLEDKIRDQQLTYVATLSHQEAWCFCIMHRCATAAFSDRVFGETWGKHWSNGKDYAVYRSWLSWLMLREGPSLLARAWETKAGNEDCSRKITKELSARSKNQVYIEEAAAKQVRECIRQACYDECNTFRSLRLFDWAKLGRVMQRVYPDVYFHIGRRLSKEVIKNIELDDSDYSS